MEIDRSTLDKIAHLARLQFNEQEAVRMVKDMTEIVSWVEQLKTVDTEGVAPLTSMSHEINALREDTAKPLWPNPDALSQAPSTKDAYFRVPNVLD
ncbi:MAG: Asp-tRNA(Asn)/Glu-tRNA(Gln) amidotransferase subunit GatC [Cytophagales bacterium]|nr:Asp-tRNA(Asn)/Glu-tRNA(Gln) amidotransferase subunit GatC [Cytophagales bacterium]